MAVAATSPLAPPDPTTLLTPLLPALTAAAASTEPAIGVLPLLSPILRQRVQFLSAASSEPWLRLLCYDASQAKPLADLVSNNPALEPHPVSGEVEVDWDYDAQKRYRRIDQETLQALYVLSDLGLAFQLVYCINDPDGGDGWRIGEVSVADRSAPFATFGGVESLAEAEKQFEENKGQKTQAQTQTNGLLSANGSKTAQPEAQEEEDDDDDDYWAQYDATPGRTPAQKRSPAPGALANGLSMTAQETAAQENDYFAQYDTVQPAMDNHDPDEDETQPHLPPSSAPPLGFGAQADKDGNINGGQNGHSLGEDIIHPRPESSASSNGSQMVARLEEEAGRQGQSEFGVKQHISRSIRSLFMLSRASGIERDEFERLVKTELDVLGMVEE